MALLRVAAHAVVDNDVLDRFGGEDWFVTGGGAVARHDDEGNTIYLARAILGLVPGDGVAVRHRNGDQLDLRRSNLTTSVPQTNGSARPRGVTFHKPSQMWMAQVKHRGKLHYLGRYESAELAAQAAQRFRLERGIP